MHHGEAAVGGRVHVEFHDGGAGGESCLHGGDGVFDELVLGRVDALGRTGLAVQALAVVCLVHAAMSDQAGLAGRRRRQPRGVPEVDRGDDDRRAKQNPAHESFPSVEAVLVQTLGGETKAGGYLDIARRIPM
jgi:hypothetical protein